MITNEELTDLGFMYESKEDRSTYSLNIHGIVIEVSNTTAFDIRIQLIELIINKCSTNLRQLTYQELKQLINLLKLDGRC